MSVPIIPTEHQEQSLVINRTIKHGLCRHPLYTVWQNMKRRLKGKDHQSIVYYSDKEICKEWLNDFKAFYDWSISNGWQEGLSIDRIDSKGNYNPSNCRWATKTVQTINTCEDTTRKDNSSGYTGVWEDKRNPNTINRWVAEIRVNGKKISLGRFKTAKDGALAYDNYIKSNNLDYHLNFKIINSLECDLIPPTVNHLYTTYSKNGKIIRTVTKEGRAFKKALSLLAKAKKFKLIEEDCSLEYTLYCSKKGRTDLDNTLKAIQDSLEGVAYKNDSQIVEILARKIRNSKKDGFSIVVRKV
ncbi:RusA family crossover junction endodeoxyribonuclease [Aliarcobacter butzleri]|uniref:RusA family crossover junction endodeoxyribonuclease n=1 Tax=Aliarcobacter butzleri TaxID=28197 RepID=UPI0012F9E050|nr:RusA family crossover junction endodeoxyribonuclease [Aliarcobacter butzleri]